MFIVQVKLSSRWGRARSLLCLVSCSCLLTMSCLAGRKHLWGEQYFSRSCGGNRSVWWKVFADAAVYPFQNQCFTAWSGTLWQVLLGRGASTYDLTNFQQTLALLCAFLFHLHCSWLLLKQMHVDGILAQYKILERKRHSKTFVGFAEEMVCRGGNFSSSLGLFASLFPGLLC